MFVLFSANSKRVKALKCLCLRDGAATCDAIFPTEHFQVFHRLFLKNYCKDFVAEPSDCCKLWRNNKSRNSPSGCQKSQIIKTTCKGLPSTSFLRNAGKLLYSAENTIPEQYEFWHSHRWSTWFINLVLEEKKQIDANEHFFWLTVCFQQTVQQM